MAWFGTVLSVAKIGVGLVNQILNPSDIDKCTNPNAILEIEETGEILYVISRFIVCHRDASMVGRTFLMNDVQADSALAIDLVQPSGQAAYLQATNTASGAYQATFCATDGTGGQHINAFTIPSGQSVIVPNAYVSQYQLANLVATSITPSTGTLPLPAGSSVLGNYMTGGVIAGATALLFTDGGKGLCNLIWNAGSGTIAGIASFTITNTSTTLGATVYATVTWNNPTTSSTLVVNVEPASTTTTNLPSSSSPIDTASVASVAGANIIPEVVIKNALDYQKKAYGVVPRKIRLAQRSIPIGPDPFSVVSSFSDSDKKLLIGLAPFLEKADDSEVEKALDHRLAALVKRAGGSFRVSALVPRLKSSLSFSDA